MLNVIAEKSHDVLILHCSGRLVAGEGAWTLYNTVISQQNERAVVLDMTGVNRVDARGLGVLVFLNQWASGAGVRMELIPSKSVRELLDLTKLRSLFEIRSPENIPSTAGLMSGPARGDTLKADAA
ncbi:MAG TPA: STAS domain-containing protein [Terriglobales bacterium]|nr:STAS domain-containing protein [Terriglobales bacterium]